MFLGVAGLSPLIARSAANLLGRRPLAVITMVLGGIVILGAVVALIASIASLKIGIIIAGIPAAALLGALGLALAKTGRAALGLTGQLARGNAARNPRRTASTAAALMIGLALVGLVSVVAESFKQSFVAQLEGSIQADYFFSDETGFAGFTPTFGQEVAALPEVGDVAMIRFSQRAIVVEGKKKDVAAVPPATVGSILKFTFNKGGYDGLDDNGILIGQDAANDLAKTVGDTVPVTFAQTGTKDLRIVGVFDKSFGQLGNWIISTKTFEANFLPKEQVDLFGGATRRPGVDAAAAKTAIKQVADSYPQVRFEDRTAFKKTQEKQIDQLLVVINALLFFSLIIALLGIANTMALSVFERTRELGLLRAVGMRRDQMRGMVRFESIIVATFGAVLGLILGVIFGIAVVAALPKNVVSTTAVPIPTLIQLLVGSIIAGLVAALFPARRAARLNVLDAIAYE